MTTTLTEADVRYFQDTLTVLMAVHSQGSDPRIVQPALDILKADGATDTDGAQVAILDRVLKMAGRLL